MAVGLERGIVWTGETGRARAMWRIFVPTIAIILINSIVGIPASRLIGSLPTLHLVVVAVTAAAALIIVHLSGRFLDAGRSAVAYGFAVDRSWLRDLAVGFGIGLAGPSILFLVAIAAGWFEVVAVFHRGDLTVGIGIAVIVLASLFTGIWEELLTRGVILVNTAEGLQTWLSPRQGIAGGVAISAILFGIPHIGQPGVADDPILLVTWILSGVVFGVLYVLSGNLGLVIGIHWSFNITYQSVFSRTDANPEEFSAITRLDTATQSPLLEFGGLLDATAFMSVLILGVLWLLYSQETLSINIPPDQTKGDSTRQERNYTDE